ncbi:MAG: ABC transporter ATP-binding protein [Planctomycetota bacterium]
MTEGARAPLVEVRGYSLELGGRRILRDVSLAVAEGEFVSVVGPNGAGKTTLLKCIMRVLAGGTGEIRVAGRPLGGYTQRELARLVSYVPQADGRALPFTVREFVMMGRYPHLSPFSVTRPEDEEAVERAMEMTGSAPFADRPLDTLSGGERQGALIAAALAQGAGLLLLDEPATFLDPRHEADMARLLRRANREGGVTVVAVTHDVNAAALRSDRVVALKGGTVVFAGTGRELMTDEVLGLVYDKRFAMVEHPTAGMPVAVPDAFGEDPRSGVAGPDGTDATNGTGS